MEGTITSKRVDQVLVNVFGSGKYTLTEAEMGAARKVAAYMLTEGGVPTIKRVCKKAVRDYVLEGVRSAVWEVCGLQWEDVLEDTHRRAVAELRYALYHIYTQRMNVIEAERAEAFGNLRDRSTIRYGLRRVEDLLAMDANFSMLYERLAEKTDEYISKINNK